MRPILQTLLHTIRHYKLIPTEATIVVAVSGGADSITLLHGLMQLQDELLCELHAATFNHGLRAAAVGDVAYVQQFAQQVGVPLTIGHTDVRALAQRQGSGIEAAARRARYEFLASVAEQHRATIIATAHHADDQSETILMHILRGSGVQGLQGMRFASTVPDHPALKLVRPLLAVRRSEIEAYCHAHHLQPRIDASNNDLSFLRNKVRHAILPQLRQVNPQVDTALNRLADIVRTEQDFVQAYFDKVIRGHIQRREGRFYLRIAEYKQWHPAMQQRAIMYAAQQLDSEPQYTHILTACHLAQAHTVGAIAEFPADVQMRVDYEFLVFEGQDAAIPCENYWLMRKDTNLILDVPCTVQFEQWELHVTGTPQKNAAVQLALPVDAVVKLRTRRPGDRIQPLGMKGHSKKLKAWFIDRKIPKRIRDRIPLLIINETIAAILVPHAPLIAGPFAINATSQRVIYCKVRKLL